MDDLKKLEGRIIEKVEVIEVDGEKVIELTTHDGIRFIIEDVGDVYMENDNG
tara:strand:+ start:1607 stop:1762 length:156 start_codon:yes stop_codon:yes gene_type:complete